jgi:tetratricopeptide (TPR) repeat protein
MKWPVQLLNHVYSGPFEDPAFEPIRRGNLLFKKGENAEAIEQFTEAIHRNPRSAAAYNNRAAARNALGDQEGAISDFSQAIQIDPCDKLALFNRGVIWSHYQGIFDKAIRDFNEVIRLDPEDAAAYISRGNAWSSLGDFDASIADFTEAIDRHCGDTSVYLGRGFARWKIGDSDGAIADCSTAISLDPKLATPYAYRGIYRSNRGEYVNAIDDFYETLRLDSGDAETCNNLAWLWSTCPEDRYRNGTKAVEYATKACELTKWETWSFLETLAAAHAETGDWENAVKFQNMAIELTDDEIEKVPGRDLLELYKTKQPCREEPKR